MARTRRKAVLHRIASSEVSADRLAEFEVALARCKEEAMEECALDEEEDR